MKRETYAQKLAELLGMPVPKTLATAKGTGHVDPDAFELPTAVLEKQLQSFRSAQGVSYFLQAPELFTAKVCPHCGEGFLVSRQYVKFCSYTCIKMDLAERGITWSRDGNFTPEFIKEVYAGNEPIWIKNEAVKDLLAAIA